jgi:hypothetical protein
MPTSVFPRASIVAALIASAFAVASVNAAEPAKPAGKSGKAPAKVPQVKIGFEVPDAQPDQVKAAELVYYGAYDCEFQQSLNVTQSSKHPAYVDVKFGSGIWLMKPVLSSTGAIRLEDVRGETLMVQIASKSMLLNVKAGKRLVDDCASPKQHDFVAQAKAAKAAGEAAPVKVLLDAGTTAGTGTTMK